jgi:hypothetical protein
MKKSISKEVIEGICMACRSILKSTVDKIINPKPHIWEIFVVSFFAIGLSVTNTWMLISLAKILYYTLKFAISTR